MSNFYHELDVESVLQCPVCYELPPKDIFLCKVGHHMCDKCSKRLTTCPTCQSPLTKSRNFLAESLIGKFSIFKDTDDTLSNNNRLGSPAKDNNKVKQPKKLQENSNTLKPLSLPPGTFRCILESCHNRKPIGIGHLFTHVQKCHAHLYEKFKNQKATFTHNFENFCLMKKTTKYHRAIHVSNMGLFFLNLIKLRDGNYINCWLSLSAPISIANKFDYQITFVKESENAKLTFSSKLASSSQTEEWLLERGNVFIISPEEHKLQDGEFFSLEIKIVYRLPLVKQS